MRLYTMLAVTLLALTSPVSGLGSRGGAPGSTPVAVRAATARSHGVSAAIADATRR